MSSKDTAVRPFSQLNMTLSETPNTSASSLRLIWLSISNLHSLHSPLQSPLSCLSALQTQRLSSTLSSRSNCKFLPVFFQSINCLCIGFITSYRLPYLYSHPGCHFPLRRQSLLITSCQGNLFIITSNASCGALWLTIAILLPS